MSRPTGIIIRALCLAISLSLALSDVSFAATSLACGQSVKQIPVSNGVQCSTGQFETKNVPKFKQQRDKLSSFERFRQWEFKNGVYRLVKQVLKNACYKQTRLFSAVTGKLTGFFYKTASYFRNYRYDANTGRMTKSNTKSRYSQQVNYYDKNTGRLTKAIYQSATYRSVTKYNAQTGKIVNRQITTPHYKITYRYNKDGRLLRYQYTSKSYRSTTYYNPLTGKIKKRVVQGNGYRQVSKYAANGRLALTRYERANYLYVAKYNTGTGKLRSKLIVTNTYRYSYTYDSQGRLQHMVYQRGWQRVDYLYHYDKKGVLTGRSIHDQRQFGKYSVRTDWVVNGQLRIKSILYFRDGRYYSYDTQGRLRQYVDARGNLYDYGYKYDQNGRISELTRAINGKEYYRELRSYDERGLIAQKAVFYNGVLSYVSWYSREYRFGRMFKLTETRSTGWRYETYYDGSCKRVTYYKDGRMWVYTKGYLRTYRDQLGRLTHYSYSWVQRGRYTIMTRLGIRDDGYVSRYSWTRITPITAAVKAALKSNAKKNVAQASFGNIKVMFKNGYLFKYFSKSSLLFKQMFFTKGVLQKAFYKGSAIVGKVMIKLKGSLLVRTVVGDKQKAEKEKKEKQEKEKKEKEEKEKNNKSLDNKNKGK